MDNLQDILNCNPDAVTRQVKKGEILQQADQEQIFAFYVKKGLLRSYLIDSKGKEHVYMFAPEGWVIGDIEAMEFEQPAQLFIDCLEDSEVIAFENNGLFHLDLDKENLAASGQLLYRRIGRLQRRVLMLMGAPIIDRYQYFIKTYPDLPNRVPQHMIASFLGVTPQTLSTVRAKLARER